MTTTTRPVSTTILISLYETNTIGYQKSKHGRVEELGLLPRLGHYVDNNSTPTMFSNISERKYFLALYPS
jgi:hypothetical protein